MKTTKKYKRLLLLWVLMVNLLPSIKDGQVTWATMKVEAQQYIVEGMVGNLYKCVDTQDATAWFPSATTSCLYAQVCACAHCGADRDCDGPCPNPLCPSNDPDANFCSCCQQQKSDDDICINSACSCSPYYNGGSDPGSGGNNSNPSNPGNTNGDNNGSISGDGDNTSSNTGYSTSTTVNWLNNNAHSTWKEAQGQCALYVRQALEAGGINTDNHPVAARLYGPYLESWGFSAVNTTNFQSGDLAVIQGYPGGSSDSNGIPYGHIQMYNGSVWISDFRQNGFWPGPGYRKYTPDYIIYRK
jgi:hypothetical protein